MEIHKYIEKIKSFESPPKVYKKFFSKKEIQELLNLYEQLPITVHNKKQNVIKKRWLKNSDKEIEKNFINKLTTVIGEFKMDNLKSENNNEDILGLFQESFGPIGIHVDAGFNLEDIIYKQTLVPFDNYGQTVIFKNKFYGYATNFTIDQKEIEEFKNQFTPGKNKRSDDHRKLYGDKDFDKKLHSQYLKHVNYDNLKGLEIELIYEWNVGDLLVFDRTHIHAASCNINKKKTGLATFTKK